MLRRIDVADSSAQDALSLLPERAIDADVATEKSVREIIAAVRSEGDVALRRFAERFDGNDLSAGLEVSRERIDAATQAVGEELMAALHFAKQRIEAFHLHQSPRPYAAGEYELRSAALARVGLYVPGGSASYPSSVLMTAVPAQVAGVGEIIMVTPRASDITLAAARVAGVHRVLEIGGAHAVAALAYGTESVPMVDKIVGPGNRYVAAAKRLVYGQVDIDSVAGPSELLVLADDSADPVLVAADLLAQAEHDADARPILVTTSGELALQVSAEVERQLAELPREEIASAAVRDHGIALVCRDLESAVAIANAYAPEHLEVLTRDASVVANSLTRAGALFVGPFTPEAAGDYTAGPNHVLPTGGAARYASPLGVADFVKHYSVLTQSRDSLAEQSAHIVALANAEGLTGHGRSVELRFRDGAPAVAKVPTPGLRVRPELKTRTAYSVPHPEGIEAKLDANEHARSLPQEAQLALGMHLSQAALNRYPDPSMPELRATIAASLQLDPSWLLFGNGSDELISLLMTTYAGPSGGGQASVAYPVPSFSVYSSAAAAVGVTERPFALDEDFELVPESTLGACAGANLVFFARPNNPTGTAWNRELILQVARDNPQTLVVVDEAYIHYGGDTFLPELSALPNIAILLTLSKIGLAALRIGILCAHPEVIETVNLARAPYNIGTLNQSAAVWVLTQQTEWIDQCVAEVVAERTRVGAALEAQPGVLRVYSSAANFLLFRVADSASVWQGLASRGVLVRHFGAKPGLEGCLRVTMGTAEENSQFLAALAAVLA